ELAYLYGVCPGGIVRHPDGAAFAGLDEICQPVKKRNFFLYPLSILGISYFLWLPVCFAYYRFTDGVWSCRSRENNGKHSCVIYLLSACLYCDPPGRGFPG